MCVCVCVLYTYGYKLCMFSYSLQHPPSAHPPATVPLKSTGADLSSLPLPLHQLILKKKHIAGQTIPMVCFDIGNSKYVVFVRLHTG